MYGIKTIDTKGLSFHVPPENGGQIVTESYACDTENNQVVMRRYDASDRTTEYYVSTALVDDDGDHWNGAPDNKRWRKVTAQED